MILSALASVVGRLPQRLATWLGRGMGDLAYVALTSRRRLALANLARAFPAMSESQRRRVCRGSFQHLGLMFVELCAALTAPIEQILAGITIIGMEHLKDAMVKHGRALVLTAHLGNWELLALAHRLMGVPTTVVMRALDAAWLDVLADRLRRRSGIELVDKRAALRPVLRALDRGRIVALLLDQNASRREGVFVSFFGRPASTSKSLAVLAVRTRTPVVPIFIYRQRLHEHRVVIHPAFSVDVAGDSEQAVAEITQRCATTTESAIAAAPDQWLWVHNRWRTRPPAEPRP
ncbi:MAG: lysophospholipid acyltransferase family protein [Candidatus Rokuibacteriota bacterium]